MSRLICKVHVCIHNFFYVLYIALTVCLTIPVVFLALSFFAGVSIGFVISFCITAL